MPAVSKSRLYPHVTCGGALSAAERTFDVLAAAPAARKLKVEINDRTTDFTRHRVTLWRAEQYLRSSLLSYYYCTRTDYCLYLCEEHVEIRIGLHPCVAAFYFA